MKFEDYALTQSYFFTIFAKYFQKEGLTATPYYNNIHYRNYKYYYYTKNKSVWIQS